MPDYTPEEAYAIYKDIKARVTARWEKRGEFMIHVVIYGIAILGYVLFVDTSTWSSVVTSVINGFMVLWTMGFAGHAMDTLFHELRERAINSEVDRMGLRHALYQQQIEKSKRDNNGHDRLVRLGEDGELVEVDPHDEEDNQFNKSRPPA